MSAKPDCTGISRTESHPENPCFGSNTIPKTINTGPSDPDYLAERRVVRDNLNELVTQAQAITSSFQELPTNMAGASVILDLPVLNSDDTGNSNISQSPETFTLQTTVTNRSNIAIAELGFELDIADDVNFTIDSTNPLQLPVDLLANDGAPGGGDSVDFTWTFTYSGTASLQPPVGMSINPVTGAELPANEIIVLEGAAKDPLGADASTAINWTSDIQGPLGTGAVLNLELKDGAHQITASVDHGPDGIASDQIALLVIDGTIIFTSGFE